jgi:hypothetical protein
MVRTLSPDEPGVSIRPRDIAGMHGRDVYAAKGRGILGKTGKAGMALRSAHAAASCPFTGLRRGRPRNFILDVYNRLLVA